MAQNKIVVKGARQNNLHNINVEIPRDKFIVFSGVSGSGKSSLAFDTIYADGQRRYIESLSSYARMFLGQMDKPDVDEITGLSPAVSIDQKTTSKNPRSTVGTVTEIYDYLRLLYARIGIPHCPICGIEINMQTIDQMVDRIMQLSPGERIQILAPVVRNRKGTHKKELEDARKSGYVRARVDNIIYDLSDNIDLDKNKKHSVDIIIDRLTIKEDIITRLSDSLETACSLTEGLAIVLYDSDKEILFSQNYSCPVHNISIEDLEPNMFSFNNPVGSCPTCTGLGVFQKVDPNLVLKYPELSIREGAFKNVGWRCEEGSVGEMYFTGLSKEFGLNLDMPVGKLSDEMKEIVLYGTKGKKIAMTRNSSGFNGEYINEWEGIVNNLERRFHETNSEWMRYEIAEYMSSVPCPDCNGQRLKPEMLAVTIGGMNISSFCDLPIRDAYHFIDSLQLTNTQEIIACQIIKELKSRFQFLINVGLDYLTLSRSSGSLSGGESQRIRLATQIGSSLMGVLYILDEPSIGLHQRDNDKLIDTLKHLRDLGNTVIVVEHDEDTLRASDYIVDIGPGAGIHGGNVVFSGPAEDIIHCKESITGQYLAGIKSIAVPSERRKGNGHEIQVINASENNLKNINVAFPLGTFTAVTGVSGSGKSSLVNEILFKSLNNIIMRSKLRPGKHDSITGTNNIDKVIGIDQSPIGRSPRSNPATYTGVFNDIRELFASTNDSKVRGYKAGRFSFNVRGGRCEACEGCGIIQIPMNFLSDVFVPCEVCKGKRYNRETLEVKYKGKNIFDILEMTVEEGLVFFDNIPKIKKKLQTLFDVGLGYIKIGQPATTLSGGEAQRVKLATELSRSTTGKTLYILDEPTTGLHTDDVNKLIQVLQRLVDLGNTVIVIEHNLDVIKTADYIIDLGPESGDKGGTIVAAGTPEMLASCKESYTGYYLDKILNH